MLVIICLKLTDCRFGIWRESYGLKDRCFRFIYDILLTFCWLQTFCTTYGWYEQALIIRLLCCYCTVQQTLTQQRQQTLTQQRQQTLTQQRQQTLTQQRQANTDTTTNPAQTNNTENPMQYDRLMFSTSCKCKDIVYERNCWKNWSNTTAIAAAKSFEHRLFWEGLINNCNGCVSTRLR